ncbi:TPA: erythromycin resistance leader peptide, partial [Enterococcus faecium]|nr:erythromycin resistance leader peptide [Enterococcus faecium]HEG1241543.1 erythromycin resistance leader peptide [Enterococcus faecium]
MGTFSIFVINKVR